MSTAGIDPTVSSQLVAAYQKATKALLGYQWQLTPPVRQAEQLLDLSQAQNVLNRLGQLHKFLQADTEELVRRRKLFMLADSAMLRQFDSNQIDSLKLNVWELPLAAPRPPRELAQLLDEHRQLDNSELAQVLKELVLQSLLAPTRAAKILQHLGAEKFASLAERVMRQLEVGLYVPAKRAEALSLLQGLAMLVGQASRAPTGIPKSIRNYLLPAGGGWQERYQIRHLGMLLAMGKFHVSFASEAGSFLMDKANREVVFAARSHHPLKLPQRGAQQPYATLLNPLDQALKQTQDSGESALEMLDSIVRSWGSADVDTQTYHGLSPDSAIAELLDVVVAEAATNAEFKNRSWEVLLRLFEWVPEHDGVWKGNSPVWSSIAAMAGLYWPELRNVAAEVTQPVLVRVVQNPEAMSLLSVSLGAFTLGHLSEAIEVELRPGLDDSIRDRHISAHVDAVADAYHHVFAAAARASQKQQKKAMSLLAGALNFVDRKLMKLLLVGSITPAQRAVATVAAMGVRKFRDNATEQIRQSAPGGDISPRAIFLRQLGNRDRVVAGGTAPEPTWFELELANKLLEHQPQLADSLAQSSATASRWLQDGKIVASQEPAFAAWFASVVNADPPTEFSLIFVHLQREFVNDLLLDATSVAMDGVWEKAQEALEVSRQTQQEWQEWSREWRKQQNSP